MLTITRAGLPIGLMIHGRAFEDTTVLRVAHAYEQANQWSARRPPGAPPDLVSQASIQRHPLPRKKRSSDRGQRRLQLLLAGTASRRASTRPASGSSRPRRRAAASRTTTARATASTSASRRAAPDAVGSWGGRCPSLDSYVAVTGTRGGATAAGRTFMLPSLSGDGRPTRAPRQRDVIGQARTGRLRSRCQLPVPISSC